MNACFVWPADGLKIDGDFLQGKRQPGVEAYNDMFIENNTLQKENDTLRAQLKAALEESERTQFRNVQLRTENERLKEAAGNGGNLSRKIVRQLCLTFEDSTWELLEENSTDFDKLTAHYCKLLEEKDANLLRVKSELDMLQSSVNSPSGSQRKTHTSSVSALEL